MTCHNCRSECRKFGKHRNGLARFQCRQCRKTFTEPHQETLDGMYLPVEKAELVDIPPGSIGTFGAGMQIPSPISKAGDTVQGFAAIDNRTQSLHLWGWIMYRDRFNATHILVSDFKYVPKTACRFAIVNIASK